MKPDAAVAPMDGGGRGAGGVATQAKPQALPWQQGGALVEPFAPEPDAMAIMAVSLQWHDPA